METSEQKRERLMATLTDAGGRLRVRGALNPILWLCGVVAVPCIFALSWSSHPSPLIGIVLCAVVGTALIGFLWLLFFDRERLQSEDFIIRSRTIDLIEQKGSNKAIDAATVNAISQDDFLALPNSEKGDPT